MSEGTYTVGRFGPAALGLALGPTTTDILLTIQGDGVVQSDIANKASFCLQILTHLSDKDDRRKTCMLSE